MTHNWFLNVISFFGIFGLCIIAWLFSENKKVIPWRVIISGIALQLILGACVFLFPPTRYFLQVFSNLLDGVFAAAEVGARFVFGPQIVPRVFNSNPPLGYIFAFRALPTVIFFAGLMALLENLGIIQWITNIFAKVFYNTMRLSGAEALSGAANIFVGIEAAIVVKPYLPKMTRSELCAILACCFGTAASSTLAIYVSFLRPIFPNILGHLVSASIIAIPACFVLSKILVPETEIPLTAGGIPVEQKSAPANNEEHEGNFPRETVGGEPIQRVSPLDAAIIGALDGVKMAVAIAAVLILILGLVSLIDQTFGSLASLKGAENPILHYIGEFFNRFTLRNIEGVLFFPLTILTGIPFNETWTASVIIGRRLLETAIPPYQALGEAAKAGLVSDRTVLIVSYALSGFAHLASVGIFVGGTIALIPSRRKDISELGWKALFVGTLATMMIACVAGVFDNGSPSILGDKTQIQSVPSPTVSPTVSPSPTETTAPQIPTNTTPTPTVSPSLNPTNTTPTPTVSPSLNPTTSPQITPTVSPTLSPSSSAPTVPQITPTVSPSISPYYPGTTIPRPINPTGQPTLAPYPGATIPQPINPTAQPTLPPLPGATIPQPINPTIRPNLPPYPGTNTPPSLQLPTISNPNLFPSGIQTPQSNVPFNPSNPPAGDPQTALQKQDNQKVLDKAKLFISPTQVSQYNKAIAQARKIRPNQPLYAQAQQDIERWSQVILDAAEGRAKQGNLEVALETAKLVPNVSPPTYQAAQRSISLWKKQISLGKNNQKLLTKIEKSLSKESASSYNRAIATARKITPDQPMYPQAQDSINRWSKNILAIAYNRAQSGRVYSAIEVALLVPKDTSSYPIAQKAINAWKAQIGYNNAGADARK